MPYCQALTLLERSTLSSKLSCAISRLSKNTTRYISCTGLTFIQPESDWPLRTAGGGLATPVQQRRRYSLRQHANTWGKILKNLRAARSSCWWLLRNGFGPMLLLVSVSGRICRGIYIMCKSKIQYPNRMAKHNSKNKMRRECQP